MQTALPTGWPYLDREPQYTPECAEPVPSDDFPAWLARQQAGKAVVEYQHVAAEHSEGGSLD